VSERCSLRVLGSKERSTESSSDDKVTVREAGGRTIIAAGPGVDPAFPCAIPGVDPAFPCAIGVLIPIFLLLYDKCTYLSNSKFCVEFYLYITQANKS
jgi:hypothetical protein